MHTRLIDERFNRRYVLGPLLLSIAMVVTGFVITEVRRAETRHLADTLRERQDEVIRLLWELAPEEVPVVERLREGLDNATPATSLESLRVRERERSTAGLNTWTEALRLNTLINLCGSLFTIMVLVVLGLLASRDLRRREGYAAQLAGEIEARTRDVRDLSQHMSRVAEVEKHSLSRELHDELGGLLVALRMDIAQLRKRTGADQDADVQKRWARVEQALVSGLELKNRVIEELRPTLLDNMGLFSALRWMANQSTEQARIELVMQGMDEDVELPPETAIAVFRTAQEAIANIVRHAQAHHVWLKARMDERLTLEIIDDGRGLPADSELRTGSHGLKQMRFRMESVGGMLRFESNALGGTTVLLSAPLPPA
jgi:signal transduction histidine kinase